MITSSGNKSGGKAFHLRRRRRRLHPVMSPPRVCSSHNIIPFHVPNCESASSGGNFNFILYFSPYRYYYFIFRYYLFFIHYLTGLLYISKNGIQYTYIIIFYYARFSSRCGDRKRFLLAQTLLRAIRKITNFLNELRKFFFPSKPNVNVIWSPFVLIYIYIFIGAANEVLKQFYTNSTQQIW